MFVRTKIFLKLLLRVKQNREGGIKGCTSVLSVVADFSPLHVDVNTRGH